MSEDLHTILFYLEDDTIVALPYHEGRILKKGKDQNTLGDFDINLAVKRLCENGKYWAGREINHSDIKLVKVALFERAFYVEMLDAHTCPHCGKEITNTGIFKETLPTLCTCCGRPDCSGEC